MNYLQKPFEGFKLVYQSIITYVEKSLLESSVTFDERKKSLQYHFSLFVILIY